MIRYSVFLLVFLHALALSEPRIRPPEWAVPIIGSELENLYQVDEGIFRSQQPDDEAFEELSEFGIVEVLNLREYHTDNSEAKGLPLKLNQLRMETGSVSEAEIVRALSVIQNRQGPLFVPCWHGSDRTGATIAAYRIIFQGWTKDQALDEMINGGYGYHASVYPNLVRLIRGLDVDEVRRELGFAGI